MYFLYLERRDSCCDDADGFGASVLKLQAPTLAEAHAEIKDILDHLAGCCYPLKTAHLIEGQAECLDWRLYYQRFTKKQWQKPLFEIIDES